MKTILIIAEKPAAPRRIVNALGDNSECSVNGITYYLVKVNHDQEHITSTAGHLYGLHTMVKGAPVFSPVCVPLWSFDKQKKSNVMMLSSLINEELVNSFKTRAPTLDLNNIQLGETRHVLD